MAFRGESGRSQNQPLADPKRINQSKLIYVGNDPINRMDTTGNMVLAWALVQAGNQSLALNYLQLSSRQKFTPATVDLGQLVCRGMGISAPDPRSAVGLLWLAFRRGHRAALGRICYIYRKERLGFGRRVLGCFIAPIAFLWYAIPVSINPFSLDVYLIDCRDGKPLLRSRTAQI